MEWILEEHGVWDHLSAEMKIFLRSTRSTRGRKFVLRDAAPRFREVPL